MISSTNDLTSLLYSSSTVKTSAGCLIEYNMNSLIDNIVIDYDSSIESKYFTAQSTINPFKKLFPIDSVVKPFRPQQSGVKYYILWDADINANPSSSFSKFPYPKNSQPRMYYPATTNYYKYWVTPVDSTFDITLRYIQSSATIASAYSSGPTAPYPNRIIYTTTAKHGFVAGQTVTITGGTSAVLRLQNKKISSILSPTQFLIEEDNIPEATSTGGVATLSEPTKPALANKIVVRFEKYHKIPANCTIKVTYDDNTSTSDIPFNSASYPDGNLEVYWTGTTWQAGPMFSNIQPFNYPAPKKIKQINVKTTTSSGAGRIYGIIEISARWVKDISQDIVSFEIQKESTATEDTILPVGTITANSISMTLAKYDQQNIRVLPYNRDENWASSSILNDVIYFHKNVEITPYLFVHHANGTVVDGTNKYDRIKQGTFYIDTYDISTYGETNITALDGAKYLMETVPIDLFLEDVPATSVIMALLDTIGFTNYNFNVQTPDTSVPVMRKWWTDNRKTTWDHLQELCRDIQMNAFFDENNVLQLYSRDKIYNESTVSWKFFESDNSNSGGNPVVVGGQTINALPGIVSFSKKELASANQVKVVWRTPISSIYEREAEVLWSSEPTFLISGGLANTISSTTNPENINFDVTFENQEITSSFNFSGYFLVNSEIFEYDAIQFKYTIEDTGAEEIDWIESKSQWASLRAISKVDPQYFQPTGKFRIKKRGVFGTTKSEHKSVAESSNSTWRLVQDTWDL